MHRIEVLFMCAILDRFGDEVFALCQSVRTFHSGIQSIVPIYESCVDHYSKLGMRDHEEMVPYFVNNAVHIDCVVGVPICEGWMFQQGMTAYGATQLAQKHGFASPEEAAQAGICTYEEYEG